MRTLIITGTATPFKKGVYYNVFLYGQTEDHPLCVFICSLSITCSGHTKLVDICKKKYTAYFNTNEFNIITMENLHIIPSQRDNQKATPRVVKKLQKALMDLTPEKRTGIYHKYLKEHGWPKDDLAQKTETLHHHLQKYNGVEYQLLFLLWYQTLPAQQTCSRKKGGRK